MIDHLFEGNRRFVDEVFETDRPFYDKLCEGQKPDVFWIGCSDSRVPAETITASPPGRLFMHRNVANIVGFNDNNFGAILNYALDHLHIRDVVICGHTHCGGLTALAKGHVDDFVIQDWLNAAAPALGRLRRLEAEHPMDDVTRIEVLAQYNVLEQMARLGQFAIVRHMREKGAEIRIHGLMYDFRTGLLTRCPEDPAARFAG